MVGKAPPRPTPTHFQAARTPDHEDGVHVRDAPLVLHERGHEKTVGQEPTGARKAYLSESTIVTRGPAGSCVISITSVVAVAKKDDSNQAIDEGLDYLAQDATETTWWERCLSATSR